MSVLPFHGAGVPFASFHEFVHKSRITPAFKIAQAILVVIVYSIGIFATAILLAAVYVVTLVVEKRKRRNI
jgi:hypothetical protein